VKLYFAPGTCALSPHIAALEAGLEVELVKVNIKTHTLADGSDYYAINAKGYVPLLELDDGRRLSEGPAIVQFIADQKPASGLAPAAGTFERYQLQEWLNFITAELHKPFGPLFASTTPEAHKAIAIENIGKRFTWIAKQLEGNDYLMGKQFTVADAYLFTMLQWTKHVGIDLGKWPTLVAYEARVRARPKVQEVLVAEGLVKKPVPVTA
jgi:glutathione S-transferase